VDACGAPAYYKLTAVDVHGNESAPSALAPAGTLGVGDEAPATRLELSRPQPNPATTSTALAFVMPSPGAVQLSVYDAAGRKVRELVSGPLDAGARTVRWDLMDSWDRLAPAGLYFIHLATPAGVRVQRVVVAR